MAPIMLTPSAVTSHPKIKLIIERTNKSFQSIRANDRDVAKIFVTFECKNVFFQQQKKNHNNNSMFRAACDWNFNLAPNIAKFAHFDFFFSFLILISF